MLAAAIISVRLQLSARTRDLHAHVHPLSWTAKAKCHLWPRSFPSERREEKERKYLRSFLLYLFLKLFCNVYMVKLGSRSDRLDTTAPKAKPTCSSPVCTNFVLAKSKSCEKQGERERAARWEWGTRAQRALRSLLNRSCMLDDWRSFLQALLQLPNMIARPHGIAHVEILFPSLESLFFFLWLSKQSIAPLQRQHVMAADRCRIGTIARSYNAIYVAQLW